MGSKIADAFLWWVPGCLFHFLVVIIPVELIDMALETDNVYNESTIRTVLRHGITALVIGLPAFGAL